MPNNKSTRFEYLVNAIKNHTTDECLIWPFSFNGCGYGNLQAFGRTNKAHRVAFRVVHGRFPTPCGLHQCDDKRCFNPSHISEGTVTENNKDRDTKGRQARGEKIHLAILTAENVAFIRGNYKWGNGKLMAKQFGVHPTVIYKVMSGRVWKHVH